MARKFHPPVDAPPYRVLLVEDHTIVREGLAAILAGYPEEFSVCGQAASSLSARELTAQLQPHLIILDYFLGDSEDGAHLLQALAKLCPASRRLVLSLTDENDLAERALRSGAHGYLAKNQGTGLLLDACRALVAGGLYVSPELHARLLDGLGETPSARPTPLSSLTDREIQVFHLLGSGLSAPAIGRRLGVSAKTVSAHRENLKNKLGYESADDLVHGARAWLRRTLP